MPKKTNLEKKDPPNVFTFEGVDFTIIYSYPSNRSASDEPCRAMVTPVSPTTGKKLTKNQLYGNGSCEPVNKTVYGRNKWDIFKNKLDNLAVELIQIMRNQGYLPFDSPSENNENLEDLGKLACCYKEDFFAYYTDKRKWVASTVKGYQGQYDAMAGKLVGIPAGSLDGSLYKTLQESICLHALEDSEKANQWKYGDEPPSSGGTRMNLLYLLIDYLKTIGIFIPVTPYQYRGKPSHTKMLLQQTDHVRSLPENILTNCLRDTQYIKTLGLLADTGLRKSEGAGLLFSSINSIETSQGTMYYLDVTGQARPGEKRTEVPKTPSAYRSLPLSQELGKYFAALAQEMESRFEDISLELLCRRQSPDGDSDPVADSTAWHNDVDKHFAFLLKRPEVVEIIKNNRSYTFDELLQDEELLDNLVPYSLRRNFITCLHCFSGLTMREIYRQSGHVKKHEHRRLFALTPEDRRLMCLRKYVAPSLFHEPHPLRYKLDGPYPGSEVPACCLELEIPPGAAYELIVTDTEPGTVTHLEGDGLVIDTVRKEELFDVSYTYALLADEDVNQKKHKLLE